MAKKRKHFSNAFDRFHHQEVLEAVQENPVVIAIDPENTSLELEEEKEQGIVEEVVEEEDYFCSGGGCVCEEPVMCNAGTFAKLDDEDLRFGEPLSPADVRLETFNSRAGINPGVFCPKTGARSGRPTRFC